jgi:hypothetical protein
MTTHRVIRILGVLVLGMTALAGCGLFDFRLPGIDLKVQAWYSSDMVLIPFYVHGDGNVAYARYTFEAYDGAEWLIQDENEIRVPSGSSGVLEYTADWAYMQHRLTFSLLQTRDATGVPTPLLTEVRQFQIDNAAPGVWDPALTLTPSQPEPPPYSETEEMGIDVSHEEFGAPFGSWVRMHFTTDGSIPTQYSEFIDWEDAGYEIWLWGPGSTGQDILLRVIMIDDAGNRSAVRTERYATF